MTTAEHSVPMHRTSPVAITATLLAALLSLVVLLQWLPTMSAGVSDATAAASSAGLDPITAQLLPLFIAAAVVVIVAVTAVLLDRSRRRAV